MNTAEEHFDVPETIIREIEGHFILRTPLDLKQGSKVNFNLLEIHRP